MTTHDHAPSFVWNLALIALGGVAVSLTLRGPPLEVWCRGTNPFICRPMAALRLIR
jgi:hypothetical protein